MSSRNISATYPHNMRNMLGRFTDNPCNILDNVRNIWRNIPHNIRNIGSVSGSAGSVHGGSGVEGSVL